MAAVTFRAAVTWLVLLGPAQAGTEAGNAAVASEEWETARAEFQPAAEQGDPWAQYNLGVLHQKGLGGPEDLEAAFAWFERSAQQKNRLAAFALGLLCAARKPPDLADAYMWFRVASRLGHAEARQNLYPVARAMSSDEVAQARLRADELLQAQ
jgi:hypothetical protein